MKRLVLALCAAAAAAALWLAQEERARRPASQAGTSRDWSLTWPSDAELLWWLESPPSFEPGRSGAVPLTPELGVLRIP